MIAATPSAEADTVTTRHAHMVSGAIEGFIAWTAFGVVEIALFLLPAFLFPMHLYVGLNPGFTATLIAMYAVAGAALGAAIGLFLKPGKTELQTAATCSLLAVYAALGSIYLRKPEILAALVAAGLILGAIIGLRRDIAGRLAAGFRNPWIVSILLLGSSSVARDYLRERPLWLILTASLGFMIVFYGLVMIFANLLPWRQESKRGRLALIVAVLVLAGVLMSAYLRQQPLVVSQKLGAAPAGKPNVIVITLDTVRADHLSLYGYERPTTPNIEQFARESVLYTNAFSAADVTLSAHASLFTGLYAIRHGAHYQKGFSGGKPLAGDHSTLAEILANRGYDTAAVVANAGFLSSAFGLGQGFAYYDQRVPTPFLGRTAKEYSLRSIIRKMLTRFSVPRHYDQITRRASEINAAVFEQLDRMKQGGRPFFLFINYMDAHWPYIPPEPFHTKFSGIDESFGLAEYFKLLDDVVHRRASVTEDQRRHLLSQYDGAIAYLDSELAKLFTRLREIQLLDNSIIVITSDHGEAFGERNLMEHGISVYQDQVHVPWLIRYPAGFGGPELRGVTVREAISSVDLLPTVADAIGVEAPKGLNGISLLRRNPGEDRPVYSESYPRGSLLVEARFRRTERAIISRQWKLIDSTAGKCELYDLKSDAAEAHNLCREQESVSGPLLERLKLWARTGESTTNSAPRPDPQTMEMLKSLGYVQ